MSKNQDKNISFLYSTIKNMLYRVRTIPRISTVRKKKKKISMKFSNKEFTNFKMHALRCGATNCREESKY